MGQGECAVKEVEELRVVNVCKGVIANSLDPNYAMPAPCVLT
jgi:hypothetical protein